jgi:hypothetical protein
MRHSACEACAWLFTLYDCVILVCGAHHYLHSPVGCRLSPVACRLSPVACRGSLRWWWPPTRAMYSPCSSGQLLPMQKQIVVDGHGNGSATIHSLLSTCKESTTVRFARRADLSIGCQATLSGPAVDGNDSTPAAPNSALCANHDSRCSNRAVLGGPRQGLFSNNCRPACVKTAD